MEVKNYPGRKKFAINLVMKLAEFFPERPVEIYNMKHAANISWGA